MDMFFFFSSIVHNNAVRMQFNAKWLFKFDNVYFYCVLFFFALKGESKSEMIHSWDVWHGAKNLGKKLTKVMSLRFAYFLTYILVVWFYFLQYKDGQGQFLRGSYSLKRCYTLILQKIRCTTRYVSTTALCYLCVKF